MSRLSLAAALAALTLTAALAGCSDSGSDDSGGSQSPAATESTSPSPTDTGDNSPAPTGSQGTARATFTPAGPYSGGETVTVDYTGFKPNEAVDVTICAGDGRPLAGPQSCAPLGGPSSKLVSADATGAGTTEIVIIAGPLGNTEPPALTCGPDFPGACALTVTDLSATNLVVEPIQYK
jgi:hypothetical protein